MNRNAGYRAVTTLYLVRHGETVGGTAKGYKGTLDVPLSGKGIAEMRVTADFILKHMRIASHLRQESYLREIHGTAPDVSLQHQEKESAAVTVYCSGLSRARESAAVIGAVLSARPTVLEELRERHFGIWEGKTFQEIKRDYPQEFSNWASDPVRFSPPEGETTRAVHERTVSALSRIFDVGAGDEKVCSGNIVIVAHGGVNRVILCHIMGIPLQNIFRIEQDNGAVSIIEFWGNRPVVKFLNLSPGVIRLRESDSSSSQ